MGNYQHSNNNKNACLNRNFFNDSLFSRFLKGKAILEIFWTLSIKGYNQYWFWKTHSSPIERVQNLFMAFLPHLSPQGDHWIPARICAPLTAAAEIDASQSSTTKRMANNPLNGTMRTRAIWAWSDFLQKKVQLACAGQDNIIYYSIKQRTYQG